MSRPRNPPEKRPQDKTLGTLLPLVAVLAALAIGSVYPWGYFPLFAASALIGSIGLVRGVREVPWFAGALLLIVVAMLLQLVPLPAAWLERVTPNTPKLLAEFNLAYRVGLETGHTTSIVPESTQLAVLAMTALSIYIVGAVALLRDKQLRRFPIALMIVGVPMGLFGIVSRQFGQGFVYGFWVSQEHGVDVAGSFINRNHFAGWMLMATLVCLGWWIGQFEATRRTAVITPGRFEWISSASSSQLITAGAAIASMVVALVWPLSRSAIVGLVAGLGWLAVLIARRSQVETRTRVRMIVSLVLVFAAAILLRGTAIVGEWFGDVHHFEGRVGAWQDTMRVFADFPAVGTGINTFGAAMLFYQRSNPGRSLSSAHNDYLQILSDGGLLVAFPAALAILALVFAIRRRLAAVRGDQTEYWIRAGAVAALVAVGVQEIFEFSLQIPADAFLFCTVIAVALAPSRTAAGDGTRARHHALAAVCPRCASTDLVRSRTRNRWEAWRKEITQMRPHRCRQCGWRDWLGAVTLARDLGSVPAKGRPPERDSIDA